MKFKSTILGSASGSIAGAVASHNRFGQYFRARTIPVNPNSTFQQTVRNLMGQLTSAWSNELTSVQRAAWDDYGKAIAIPDSLGDNHYLTGLNHYVRSNVARMQAGLARVDAGPTVLTLPTGTLAVFTATASGSAVSVAFTNTDDWANEVGGALLMLAGRPQSAGVTFYGGPWRYMGKVAGAGTPPTSPSAQVSPFALAVGQFQAYQFRFCRADGRLSAPFQASDIAA